MKSMNQGYEGNTMFATEETMEKPFLVERVYYDSPREDCNGYYSDMYGFDTAKEAWKAARSWSRSDQPEGAFVELRSGNPRVYSLYVNGDRILCTENINKLHDQMKMWRKIRIETKGVLDYQVKIS